MKYRGDWKGPGSPTGASGTVDFRLLAHQATIHLFYVTFFNLCYFKEKGLPSLKVQTEAAVARVYIYRFSRNSISFLHCILI